MVKVILKFMLDNLGQKTVFVVLLIVIGGAGTWWFTENVVTYVALASEITVVQKDSERGDMIQQRQVLELRKEAITRQLEDNEDKFDDTGKQKYKQRVDRYTKSLEGIEQEIKEVDEKIK
jgi:predicted metalloprotease